MKSRISWFCHLRSIYYLRLNRMSTHKMQCEFAQHLEKGTNSKRIKYFGRSENLIAEPLCSTCSTTPGKQKSPTQQIARGFSMNRDSLKDYS
jgi:hypothetical protein